MRCGRGRKSSVSPRCASAGEWGLRWRFRIWMPAIKITLSSGVVDAVLAHAREAAPAECCGLLLGTGSSVVAAARARNTASDPTRRFEIDPQDHIDARREARGRGLAVLGFYHSHPRSPAVPSPTDLAEASYPRSEE